MGFFLKALVLLQLAVVCIQLSGGQPIYDRCWCLNTLKRNVPREKIMEFSISPPRKQCKNTEIILTLKPENTKSEGQQRCLSPETIQASNLQKCWNRVNANSTRDVVKISECFPNHK
ncbi:C-X-C motif chemokine 3-like [Paramisgurnus dabryanus]|uniref:C-X-C motif chemokine 3-like n=1 Tax=Paramisgurnus dabryanus TaxID=90735 RepID=UPI003CCF5FA7